MKTASGAYTVFGVASATTKCDLTPNSSGALVSSGGAGNGINGSILITGLGSAAGSNVCHNSVLAYPCVDSVSSSFWVTSHAGGGNLTASANKSIRLIMSSGNITAGVAKLYGIQNS
jgi:hypothetical protein